MSRPQLTLSLNEETGGFRTTRILEGKVPVVGVAGRTLIEFRGLRVTIETFAASEPFEDVEEVFEFE